MIQIDDAGSGSLIGGTCIGALRCETGEYYYEIIPPILYDKTNFKNKSYLYYTTQIVKNALEILQVNENEEIEVCQGYMFDDARKYLKNKNYKYKGTKICDPLQSLIEKTFEEYSISLGLPRDFIMYTKYPFHLKRLLKWVYADYGNRVKYCKTGWKSWVKYSSLPINIYHDTIYKSNFVCLKCGKRIKNNSKVKVVKICNGENIKIFLHDKC
ncbi:hypothetical protein [Lutispora sp.]|uniref:hypothetical protein n=1 Tax=Lutispora sp. TaxID=2828727 RepID=UPI002B1EE919|nr:hypothetical protein [Lutispora sp.]MEA4963961.1 hypothetical protein [Lutispora sp.]